MRHEKSEASKDIEDKKQQKKEKRAEQLPVCNYAPEWAEHARFYRDDEPCDDGRMGGRACAEDEEACPVTDSHAAEDVEDS